jgi:predicted HTH transcriptional regulator
LDPAKNLFDDLNNYSKLELLISNGDAEGLYLECKAQSSPQLGNDIKAKLAKAVSGFSNTEGGVIIWGISTTRHAHSSLDVLTQLEPIGSCKQYAQQIQKIIPILTTPSITKAQTKFITKKSTDTKGVVITYIPKHTSDPVQSIF